MQSLGHSCSPSLSLFHIPLETGKWGELQAASPAWAHHRLTQCQGFLSHPLLLPCSFPALSFLLSLLQAFWKHHLAQHPRFPSWEELYQSVCHWAISVRTGFYVFSLPFPEFPWLPCIPLPRDKDPAASKSSVLVPNVVTLLALPFSR